MAYEDYLTAGSDELGHYLFLYTDLPLEQQPHDNIMAIKATLKARGEWYCYHDESVQPLEHCLICGRHYTYLDDGGIDGSS